MSYEFTKLSNVPAVSEFPEGANAIIETNGEIKRCPSSNTPKPLTYDYMPEGYPKKSGWSIEWDGNTDGLISFAEGGKTFYKVSDMLPTNDELIGATIERSDGQNHELTSKDITAPTEDITMGGSGARIIRKDTTAPDNSPVQKGTYFAFRDNYYISRLSKQIVTPMAEEFLPVLTAPSGTKYKITVDDSGTISATEVTV